MLEVAPERLARWVDGFVQRHGPAAVESSPQSVRLAASDGTLAELEVPWPPWSVPPSGDAGLVAGALARHAARPRTLGLLLVRRGGWAVGTCRGGTLLTHKAGSRYVQSRTAAGGWSQQRFARRRSGQADALVGVVADAARARLDAGELEGLVVGGDRQLVNAVLADHGLAAVAQLPRSPIMEVTEPRTAVLEEAARRTLAVRVRLTDPR